MYRHGSPQDAAAAYEAELRAHLPEGRFDLLLLGLGPDAHTASLFPGDASVFESEHWVLPSTGAAGVKERITMSPPLLNRAREVLFLVAGKDKAKPLASVLNGDYHPDQFPAQIVARHAFSVLWYIDAEAASEL
jgi:6-phosphogluconolactonase